MFIEIESHYQIKAITTSASTIKFGWVLRSTERLPCGWICGNFIQYLQKWQIFYGNLWIIARPFFHWEFFSRCAAFSERSAFLWFFPRFLRLFYFFTKTAKNSNSFTSSTECDRSRHLLHRFASNQSWTAHHMHYCNKSLSYVFNCKLQSLSSKKRYFHLIWQYFALQVGVALNSSSYQIEFKPRANVFPVRKLYAGEVSGKYMKHLNLAQQFTFCILVKWKT